MSRERQKHRPQEPANTRGSRVPEAALRLETELGFAAPALAGKVDGKNLLAPTEPATPKLHEETGSPRLTFSPLRGNTVQVVRGGDWTDIWAGAKAPEVSGWITTQLAALGEPEQRVSEATTNNALAFVSAMKPRDPAELLLLTQMAAIHQATMALAGRLNRVAAIPQQDAAERALNKLARTYAAQMETLKRYRSKGQQVVRVERVNVEAGGRAVVGHVETGRRTRGEGDDER